LKGEKRREKEKYSTQINQILDEAEIICCTLSSSGSEKLDRFVGQIEILIIDEAA
jgi:senataxin